MADDNSSTFSYVSRWSDVTCRRSLDTSCAALRRVASRRVASRRVASRRVASRRVVSRRVASRRCICADDDALRVSASPVLRERAWMCVYNRVIQDEECK